MVSFYTLLTSALALTVPVLAQTTPAQVVDNIGMLTQKSQALQGPAQSISIVNGPLLVIGQGPFPVRNVSLVLDIKPFECLVDTLYHNEKYLWHSTQIPCMWKSFKQSAHLCYQGQSNAMTEDHQWFRRHRVYNHDCS